MLASLLVERYGDVTRLRMTSAAGRTIGIDVSAYVVRGVMIDTGFVHAFEPLLRAVRGLNVRGAVVTHWHEDHAGNVASLASLGTPVLLRADTEATLRSFPRIELYRRAVWGTPSSVSSPIRAPELEGLVCVHTPGHSSDHQIVWDASTRTAFTGDLWLGVRARTMHATEDPYAINARILGHKIVGGLPLKKFYPELGNASLWCCTELTSRSTIDTAVGHVADSERSVRNAKEETPEEVAR